MKFKIVAILCIMFLIVGVGLVASKDVISSVAKSLTINKEVTDYYTTAELEDKLNTIATNEMLMEQVNIGHDLVYAHSGSYADIKAYNEYCAEYGK